MEVWRWLCCGCDCDCDCDWDIEGWGVWPGEVAFKPGTVFCEVFRWSAVMGMGRLGCLEVRYHVSCMILGVVCEGKARAAHTSLELWFESRPWVLLWRRL